MHKLEGRIALVTGAGRGIGLALVRKLLAEGARVVFNDLDASAVAQATASLAAGDRAHGVVGNVGDEGFAKAFVGAALERFGTVDVVVNNAGYVWNSPVAKITDEQWDAMHEVHVKAPFRLLRELAPVFKRSAGQGPQRKVVNVSSVAASRGLAGQGAYGAAKAGLFGLTRTLAREWGPLGVNVNCVCFGWIETRLTQEIQGETAITIEGRDYRVGLPREALDDMRQRIPLRRAGTPDDAAGAILLFCLPESDYITGQVIEVDGGGL
jgi:3-oxoacyl-[acyl-carrier protein] reductase